MLKPIARKDSSVGSKLKCKPCDLFFRDTGKDEKCPECGRDLRRILVHRFLKRGVK
jgi:rubrerythrin